MCQTKCSLCISMLSDVWLSQSSLLDRNYQQYLKCFCLPVSEEGKNGWREKIFRAKCLLVVCSFLSLHQTGSICNSVLRSGRTLLYFTGFSASTQRLWWATLRFPSTETLTHAYVFGVPEAFQKRQFSRFLWRTLVVCDRCLDKNFFITLLQSTYPHHPGAWTNHNAESLKEKYLSKIKATRKTVEGTGRCNNRIKDITDVNIWNKTGKKGTTEIRIKKIQKSVVKKRTVRKYWMENHNR